MARLQVQSLCKGWDFPVIDRLDLSVEEGEFFVIVGPSGIGKTTLLRLIAGLERPDGGKILVGEQDISGLPPYRRPVAMTFESYALYPHLSVFENIASPLRARRLPNPQIKKTVTDVAKLLRIEALLDRRPGEISGGQKQRTALGRTLVAGPEVFLLDEPLSHLDARIRHELRLQFHRLEALRSVATLYVTHDYAEALSLGDRIGVMGQGGLLQTGDAREVFQRPLNRFVAQHLGQPTINVIAARLERANGMLRAETDGGFGFPLAPAHAERLDRQNHGRVEVGIRPQHLRVVHEDEVASDGRAATRPVVDAHVELFEALGANGVLIADSDGVKLTALTPPDFPFGHGMPIRLALDTEAFFYFAPADGRNLLF